MVKVDIFGLAIDENSRSPILMLKDEVSNLVLPIWIGAMEAMSISVALNKVPFPRPMTHDLLLSMIRGMGGSVTRVEVTDIEGGTFYAEIVVEHGENTRRIDSRPSDAIALAVRAECPILVSQAVLDDAGAPYQETETVLKRDESSKWLDELEKMSEKDTKYKM